MGVHDKSSIAEEADQGKPASTRHLHCEARRRRYGCENRHAGDERLLHDLESAPPAHKKKPFRQRQGSSKKGVADYFVYGVVSADILMHELQLPVRIEQSGCV